MKEYLRYTKYGRYEPSHVIGDYFEGRISKLFDLVRIDIREEGNVPDLRARDKSFYVECKGASVRNGGVVKGGQCDLFNQNIDRTKQRIFFAFAYHPLWQKLSEAFSSNQGLRCALTRHSDEFQFYIFPFSVVLAFYDKSHKRYRFSWRQKKEPYTTMRYNESKEIFEFDEERWHWLGLDPREYKPRELHERVHLLTRQGNLEDRLVNSFHPEALE